MKHHFAAKLARVEQLDRETILHTYEAPPIARDCSPGQFVHIRVSNLSAPLLRRPISILDSDFDTHIRILFKIVRTGTALLAEKREGESVDIVGPLGNPFPYDFSRDAVMVAGGYGIAPVFFLARANLSNHNRRTLVYGARSENQLYLRERFLDVFDEVIITTEDASLGRKGLVTEPLRDLLATRRNLAVYACGPTPMLAAVAGEVESRAEHGTPCFVSVENQMGCGIGACLGCVVQTRDGFKTTCKDGPVFDTHAVLFQ
jgi:dihydroorotate dehydrogenase electron transfer subunit